MKIHGWIALTAAVALTSFAVAAGDAKDALAGTGLTKSGDAYVLADEKPVLDGVAALRKTKVDADKESRVRKSMELQIAAKKKVVKDADKEWHELEGRLSVITDVGVHNRVVTRMNRLLLDYKQALSDEKDFEEKASKSPAEAKTKFVDEVAALAPKADAVSDHYKSLASDATVTAELDKRRTAGDAAAKLGPSAPFTTASADLKKWQSEVESEAIPMREEGGIHFVDVLLNGERFVLGVDTGASAVSLTGEVAEKLHMVPGEKDPVIQMQMADGNLIEGHEMTLKSVRVGRFTVEDVRCVVLNKGLTHAPLLLGGSFLNHFIVKVDPAKSELHLTEIKSEGTAKVATTAPKKS